MLYTHYICICIGHVLLLAMPPGTYILCIYRHICMYVLLMFTEPIWVWYHYYPPFTNEDIEAQGGQETVGDGAGIQTQANWPGGGRWGKCISVFVALSTFTPHIRRAPIEIPERMIWGGLWSKFLPFQAQYPHSPWQLPHWSCLTIGLPRLQSCLERGLSKLQFQFKALSHSCFFYLRMKFQPTMARSASFCSLSVCCSLQGWAFRHALQCQLSLLRGTCFANPRRVLSIIPSRSGGRLF